MAISWGSGGNVVAMKIVVFKANHLGDNVVFLSGIQALRARFPDWQLTIVTTPNERVLYENLTTPGEILATGKTDFFPDPNLDAFWTSAGHSS